MSQVGWSKCNVDAGNMAGLGVGVGAVCRDDRGELQGCGMMQQRVGWEMRVTEARVVVEGVRLAKKLGASKLVESDCLQVISSLTSKSVGASAFCLIIDDILDSVKHFDVVVWSFIKRAGNQVAHMMAHLQPMEYDYRCWVDNFLDTINRYAEFDILK
ncbi:uncharacterized protein LOC125492923 [Beta vulgaris subsp. vulgaris]|uniref:uncharacterized protein LOC125492923 n=1 Tax=Beta vulgaris subsp. vulgaris TaxID=3555 RepID=UPI0020375BFF|nr:uncharacterized protein LOC125492923 [Beta vulgaris subsp. vulgaris]